METGGASAKVGPWVYVLEPLTGPSSRSRVSVGRVVFAVDTRPPGTRWGPSSVSSGSWGRPTVSNGSSQKDLWGWCPRSELGGEGRPGPQGLCLFGARAAARIHAHTNVAPPAASRGSWGREGGVDGRSTLAGSPGLQWAFVDPAVDPRTLRGRVGAPGLFPLPPRLTDKPTPKEVEADASRATLGPRNRKGPSGPGARAARVAGRGAGPGAPPPRGPVGRSCDATTEDLDARADRPG